MGETGKKKQSLLLRMASCGKIPFKDKKNLDKIFSGDAPNPALNLRPISIEFGEDDIRTYKINPEMKPNILASYLMDTYGGELGIRLFTRLLSSRSPNKERDKEIRTQDTWVRNFYGKRVD